MTATEADDFGSFFRAYTKTWVHAVATAGLTAFGTLTFVNRWFAALALASYFVPPIALYLRQVATADSTASPQSAERTEAATTAEPAATTESAETAETREAMTVTATGVGSGAESAAPSASDADSDGNSDSDSDSDSDTDSDSDSDSDSDLASDSDTDSDSDSDAASDTDSDSGAVAGSGPGSALGGVERAVPEWSSVDSPVQTPLFDVAIADLTTAFAVGAGGVVLTGADGEWAVLLEDGPGARGNDLRGVAATADGAAVWVAGDSGALGRVDVETGRHVDYSAPADRTDNLAGVAAGTVDGAETVLLINGSGEVLCGRYRDGDLAWDEPVKPGSGSSLSGVDVAEPSVAYCCDTNDGVFETTDGGASFERVGVDGADGTLTDMAAAGRGDCLASADDGVVHRYDGATWTPERVGDDALSGVAYRDERALVCDGSGAVHERRGPAGDWERTEFDGVHSLSGVAMDADRAVAVGDDGAVVERRRDGAGSDGA